MFFCRPFLQVYENPGFFCSYGAKAKLDRFDSWLIKCFNPFFTNVFLLPCSGNGFLPRPASSLGPSTASGATWDTESICIWKPSTAEGSETPHKCLCTATQTTVTQEPVQKKEPKNCWLMISGGVIDFPNLCDRMARRSLFLGTKTLVYCKVLGLDVIFFQKAMRNSKAPG